MNTIAAILFVVASASPAKWDVYTPVHDHCKQFEGVVVAETKAGALVLARKKYGPKAVIAAYRRDGLIPAYYSDHDLGCYAGVGK